MNKRLIRATVALLLIMNLAIPNISLGTETVCKIMDPTDTALNIRDEPNGRVINRLKNGREVYIKQNRTDSKGRPWVLVTGSYDGEYRVWGWAFREFLVCFSR
jgi:hypothetical protein